MKSLFLTVILNALAEAGIVIDSQSFEEFKTDLEGLYDAIPAKFKRAYIMLPILLILPVLVRKAVEYAKNRLKPSEPHPLEALDNLKSILENYLPK